jgi:hypothetical protein
LTSIKQLLKIMQELNEASKKSNTTDIKNIFIRGNNFHLDLLDFERLSRDVGFFNCMSKLKDQDDDLDLMVVSKYEELRERQLFMIEEMFNSYSK